MMRTLGLTGAAVLLAAVPGCGGGDSATEADSGGGAAGAEQYCSSLQKAQQEFGALSSGQLSGANLDRIFDRMHTIADLAPQPVADEWDTLDRGISQMQTGLQELGLRFEDLSDPSKLQSVDPQKLRKFGQDMEKVGGQKFQRAGDTIEKHARTECGIKLSQN